MKYHISKELVVIDAEKHIDEVTKDMIKVLESKKLKVKTQKFK